MIYKR